jgi:hypothetical protein
MGTTMKNIYIRLFVLTAIPFGVLASVLIVAFLVTFRIAGIGTGIMYGLTGGFCYGAMMSGILGTSHFLAAHKEGGSDWKRALSPIQVRRITLPVDDKTAVKLVGDALSELSTTLEPPETGHDGLLQIKTGTGLRSFGEAVAIKIDSAEPGMTLFTISSTPLVRTTLVDYGKGYQNVERLTDSLRKSSA